MQKWYPKSDQNGLQKGPTSEPKSPKWVPKKHRKITIFSTPECGQSIVNSGNIDDLHVLILTPFWVSFWRCFGSPNCGQGHQKSHLKKHKKMMPKMTPNWSQRGSQNGAKIIKNDVLEAPCFKGGSPSGLQSPSRIDYGKVLGSCWDHFRRFV